MKFNERLIKLRKAKGMSQEDLGYELNVTRQTISKWELGESTPEMEKLIQISNYFGISVDELISNKDEDETSKNYNKEFVGVDEKYIPNDVKNDTSYVNANKGSKKMMAIPIVVPIIILIIGIVMMVIMHRTATERMDKLRDSGTEMLNTMMDKGTNTIDTMMEKEKNTINEDKNSVSSKQQEMRNTVESTIEDTQKNVNNAVQAYQNSNTWDEEEWNSKHEEMQREFEKKKDEIEASFQNY